jgi:cell division protein FtsI/penicillin-binding protein 2
MLVAAAAFALGIYESGAAARAQRALVARYVRAWSHSDYAAMYSLLDAPSRRRLTEARFAAAYESTAMTATMRTIRFGPPRGPNGGIVDVSAVADTGMFGRLRGTLEVPLAAGPSVHFAAVLLFPGLRPGEHLRRVTRLGARGAILADNGTPLAQGPARTSAVPLVAGAIVGSLGPIPRLDKAYYEALGYPPNARVGLDGLEQIFESRLAGRIGGTLLAGRRVLASVPARPGATVRTTIDPAIETAALNALGSSYAGMTVMDPRTGALLALAGLAFSDVQPPGSTMKIITATAALQAHLATLGTVFPYETSANIDGYILHNANNESCGGTLLNAFAVSCNSVFAPLGARVGAQRLVRTAERFGFDSVPTFAGELESTIPSAATIGSSLSVASSAIGQGQDLASTLEMADVGAAIAMHGRRPIPTLVFGARPHFVRATSPLVAGEVQRMMLAVVAYGTGTAAAIPGVQVAGKTGTAELANTSNSANAAKETDAWFVGYAPAGDPRVVACALFPAAGFGGMTAAPAVREALIAALATHL